MNSRSKLMRKVVLFALVLAGTLALMTVGSGDAKARSWPSKYVGGGSPVATTIVPDVLVEPLSMAEHDIRAAGLVPKWSGNSQGSVTFQAPKAGTSVAVGSTVTIYLGD